MFKSAKQKEKVIFFLFVLLYFLGAIIPILIEFHRSSVNNYLIFKQVYFHTRLQVNLFSLYPNQYFDSNHYGIFFSLLIAPFALLPDWLGIPLWTIMNSLVLFYSIGTLKLSLNQKYVIWLLCINDVITSSFSAQINPLIAALFILSFVAINENKEMKASIFIFLGAFIKLYTIVALVFIFLAKRPYRFIMCSIMIFIVFFLLPIVISSVHFDIQSYADWYHSLLVKDMHNRILYNQQDFSLMGMVRRVFGKEGIPNMPFIVSGLVIYFLPYFRTNVFQNSHFQYYLLASALIFPVIFSTSSESPTYIIAMSGVAIWFVNTAKREQAWNISLLVLAIIFTSLSPTDVFPKWMRDDIFIHYSIKALPCSLIWLSLSVELIFANFEPESRVPLFNNLDEVQNKKKSGVLM